MEEAATGLTQSFAPIKQICTHVCAFHCYAHDTTRQVSTKGKTSWSNTRSSGCSCLHSSHPSLRQVRAHHYCRHLNQDMRQCVIYDSDQPDARLIGIEYIISQRLFDTLPADEKVLWHSHVYEVKSGHLLIPPLPEAAIQPELQDLVGTYGKTWHTWQVRAGRGRGGGL